jgi:hypothetical protein
MNRNRIRLGAGLLAAVVTAAAVPAVSASDVSGHWAQAAMESYIESGYLRGYENGDYAPDQTITKAEFAALVNRVAGISVTETTGTNWYDADLAAAVAAGYMADAKAPNGAMTEQAAASMLAKLYGSAAADAVAQLPASDAALTRAEAVTVLSTLNKANEGLEGYRFVLMNIPYDAFYAAEVDNDVAVDAVSSATLSKTRTSSLVSGSYHVDSAGSDITGITFPVAVPVDADLSAYKQVTDTDSVTISVTNRGQTSETTYTGKDALFENASYAYYALSTTPSYYKVATVADDGTLTFGETVGEVTALSDASATITTNSSYGDYQISLSGLGDYETVYAVVLTTKEGDSYGLRHLENVWRVSELAWSSGFTEQVHGCPMSAEHYAALMGQTITAITYYTEQGVFSVDTNLYVPVKFANTVSADDAAVDANTTAVTLDGFPADYEAVYAVTDASGNALDTFSCNGTTLTWTAAQPGSKTLTISDASGKYAPYTATFTLTTDALPAAEGENAIIKANDASEADFANYLSCIATVNVNGTDYSASGKGAVAVLDDTGAVDFSTSAFTELAGQTVQLTVTATGYTQALTITVKVPETLPEAQTQQFGH